jgi:hypothetical protein
MMDENNNNNNNNYNKDNKNNNEIKNINNNNKQSISVVKMSDEEGSIPKFIFNVDNNSSTEIIPIPSVKVNPIRSTRKSRPLKGSSTTVTPALKRRAETDDDYSIINSFQSSNDNNTELSVGSQLTIVNSNVTMFLTRLSALEANCSKLEASNAQLLGDNIILRDKMVILEGQLRDMGVSNGPVMVSVDNTVSFRAELDKIASRVDVLEVIKSEVEVEKVIGGGVRPSSVPVDRMDIGEVNVSCKTAKKSSVHEIWQSVANKRTVATKKLVATVVKEEIGKVSLSKRVVVTGLPFAKDKHDEDVVRAFLQAQNVSTPFNIFKRVKDKLDPLVTRIIVIDVGSEEIRDSLLRAVKPSLKGSKIYVNEDKSLEDQREEYKLRQEARDKTKILTEEDRLKIRYAVRKGKVVDLGQAGFTDVSSPPAISSANSSLSLELGLGLANNHDNNM